MNDTIMLTVRFPNGTNAASQSMTAPDGRPTWVTQVPVDRRRFNAILSGIKPGDRVSAWLNSSPMTEQQRATDGNDVTFSADLFGNLGGLVEPLSDDGGVSILMVQVDHADDKRWIGRLIIGTGLFGHLMVRGVASLQKGMLPHVPANAFASHQEGRLVQ